MDIFINFQIFGNLYKLWTWTTRLWITIMFVLALIWINDPDYNRTYLFVFDIDIDTHLIECFKLYFWIIWIHMALHIYCSFGFMFDRDMLRIKVHIVLLSGMSTSYKDWFFRILSSRSLTYLFQTDWTYWFYLIYLHGTKWITE